MERSVESLLNLYRQKSFGEGSTIRRPGISTPGLRGWKMTSLCAPPGKCRTGRSSAREGAVFHVELGDEPIVVARGEDGVLRAFYNVCRHHAAAVVTEAHGCAKQFRCRITDDLWK